ncbi:hypothetical protein ACHAW5_003339 [Stephanodiscus triporus]|uniref:Uncharacterized protein n=1 Tax=Stephanodiscus triporus TaxID=2934178 RepID=A0ABD3PF55_9STRA
MKKGKANLPSHMRSQQAIAGDGGLPTADDGESEMWYPAAPSRGREVRVCQSYASDGLLASVSKNQLDAGVGSSLARDRTRLEETIVRGYPQ